ncbi:chitin synthase N-terminal-domain-containing protein [Immersiella caudata]|uniref:chitin synthase n=1 Tax=Immersiella caudata TaxID=314043 RepID=A0AA40BUQ5_9PEZI|nr:chitin synthase N-terminal-domain-containing protein [Immersiella caudata]
MADPFSIAASCVGLLAAISTATIRISEFVHNARTARTDLDAVSRELGSLRTVLELIQTDAENSQNQLPQTIVHHLCEVLTNCNGAVADIETVLRKYEKSDAVTSSRWALSGRGDVEKLRAHLEAHTSALGLVLDMMNLVVSIKVRQETSTIHAQTTDIKLDTANILAKIDQLQARLPSLGAEEKDDYMLQRYLEEMTTYTEGMLSSVEPEDGLALEAADGEMVALERFLNDPDDSSKASTQLTPPPSTSAAAEPPQVQQLPVRVPQSGKGKFALFSGNLVIDIPLPQKTLSKFPHAPDGGRDEFTHVRYTAVTCDPDSFHEKGYSLRAGLFAKPRTTDLLFSVFFDTGHRATVFDVLSKVWDAMDHFHQLSLLGPLAFKEVRWKHVVLHLHFATLPTGESASCLDAISSRPMWYEGPGLSLFSEMSSVNGESVLWQMYEVRHTYPGGWRTVLTVYSTQPSSILGHHLYHTLELSLDTQCKQSSHMVRNLQRLASPAKDLALGRLGETLSEEV